LVSDWFYDAVSIPHYVTSTVRWLINDELTRIWKEEAILLLRYYHYICLEGLTNITISPYPSLRHFLNKMNVSCFSNANGILKFVSPVKKNSYLWRKVFIVETPNCTRGAISESECFAWLSNHFTAKWTLLTVGNGVPLLLQSHVGGTAEKSWAEIETCVKFM
jgi:hypothetical protein